jgi:hypothetical protein
MAKTLARLCTQNILISGTILLYTPCQKMCPILLLFQRQTKDSFCGREHKYFIYDKLKFHVKQTLTA